MPTYEYACATCGQAWEEIQKISEPAIELCPACQKTSAKRQISGGTFILKGGGWYSDLYSSSSNKPAAKESNGGDSKPAEGASPPKTETKSETKAETNSPTKTETKPAAA